MVLVPTLRDAVLRTAPQGEVNVSGLRSFHEDLLRLVLTRSPIVATIVDRWPQIGLPDCWLVAGCLAQTVWNDAFGLPVTHGISDIDLVYFDGQDLSAETEAGHAVRLRTPFADLGLWIDVKNKARVHLGTQRNSATFSRPMSRPRTPSRPFRQQQPRSACSSARAGFMSSRRVACRTCWV
jgi:hypothetical protein